VPDLAGFYDKFSGECLPDNKGFLREPIFLPSPLPAFRPSSPPRVQE